MAGNTGSRGARTITGSDRLNFACINPKDERRVVPAVAISGLNLEDGLSSVRMVGFQGPEAVNTTLSTGHVTLHARGDGHLWTKGERSGNFLDLRSTSDGRLTVFTDCLGQAAVMLADPEGPTCHKGSDSCMQIPPTGEEGKPGSVRMFTPGTELSFNKLLDSSRREIIPAVVIDPETLAASGIAGVLAVGVMTRQDLDMTLNTTRVNLSAANGEQSPISNNVWARVDEQGYPQIAYDCDRDTVVISAVSDGPACYTGAPTCFQITS